jgi:hypothetical protein
VVKSQEIQAAIAKTALIGSARNHLLGITPKSMENVETTSMSVAAHAVMQTATVATHATRNVAQETIRLRVAKMPKTNSALSAITAITEKTSAKRVKRLNF